MKPEKDSTRKSNGRTDSAHKASGHKNQNRDKRITEAQPPTRKDARARDIDAERHPEEQVVQPKDYGKEDQKIRRERGL